MIRDLHIAEAEYQTIIQLCKERFVHTPVTKQEVKKVYNYQWLRRLM
jgi:hypothetical protein